MSLAQLRVQHRAFNSVVKLSIVLTYLVILAGSVVRNTGSGMGCPDWPKCFGQWVPPTSEAQLPNDYRNHYVEHRRQRNERFAALLDKIGKSDVAKHILTDEAVYNETPFNAFHTWTEYVNRLVGALLGLSLVVAFALSLPYFKMRPAIPLRMFGIIVLTAIQGWFGSIVVSTNLLPGTITVHMALAIAILTALILLYVRTSQGKQIYGALRLGNTLWYAFGTLLLLSLIQVYLGTQVRQNVDIVAAELGRESRHTWIDQLGVAFKIHRSFSFLILGLTGFVVYQVNRFMNHYWVVYRMTWILAVLVLIETLSGISMAWFGMPVLAQPIHMLVGSMVIGAQVYLLAVLSSRRHIA